jgi:outer membrane murein-binding lipoprotein Lpp
MKLLQCLLWAALVVAPLVSGCSALPDSEIQSKREQLAILEDKLEHLKVSIIQLPRLNQEVEQLEMERDKLEKKREALRKR